MQSIWVNETDEKRLKLLNAGLEEFAKKGYELASTNAIIQRAEVSKGLLFHHFQSKKEMYIKIAKQCIAYFFSYLRTNSTFISPEPLERLRDIQEVKMKLFIEEPLIYELSVNFFINRPEELRKEIIEIEEDFNRTYFSFYFENINLSKVRQPERFEKSVRIIIESIEALTRAYIEKTERVDDNGLKDLLVYQHELSIYLDILEHGLYFTE